MWKAVATTAIAFVVAFAAGGFGAGRGSGSCGPRASVP
jgi:hypothetical protein